MKFIVVVLLFLGLSLSIQAQEIDFNGTTYVVKGKSIFLNGADVTSTFSVDQQAAIRTALNKKEAFVKESKKAAKQIKKAEKEQRNSERKLKEVEKELKRKEKAQSNYDKAGESYSKAIKKYKKLKRKGKLSPNDEEKWLEKIKNFKEDNDKAEKKLKRS